MYGGGKMSKEDHRRAVERGFIKDRTSTPKKTSYSLVWVYCGKEEVIIANKPYGYCVAVRKTKECQPQYRVGTFKIK